MGLRTLLLYLLGHRSSIEAVHASPQAVWLGFLFVLPAGFAREYDGEDLLHEPWHVLIPLGASLLTSFLLFALLDMAFAVQRPNPTGSVTWQTRYKQFLGLYWLTAPLAWLYAIPVEQFLSAGDSVAVNLSLLGVVSLWRVLLITRVVSILYARSFVASFFVVMLFADTVAMVIFYMTPLPILSVMGGIRLSESEEILLTTGLLVRFLGTVSWPIWLIGAVISSFRSKQREEIDEEAAAVRVSKPLWALAAVSLLVWAGILPFTQPQQIHRRTAERLLTGGQIAEAVEFMSGLRREDFPRHWDPPPRTGFMQQAPAIERVLVETESPAISTWVRDLYRNKLMLQYSAHYYPGGEPRLIQLASMDDELLSRYVQALQSSSFGREFARYHEYEVGDLLESPDRLSDVQRKSLEQLRELISKEADSQEAD